MRTFGRVLQSISGRIQLSVVATLHPILCTPRIMDPLGREGDLSSIYTFSVFDSQNHQTTNKTLHFESNYAYEHE